MTRDNKAIFIGLLGIILVSGITFFRPKLSLERLKNIFASNNGNTISVTPENEVISLPTVSTKNLADKMAKGKPVLIDIRESNDFAREHLLDSINIPADDIETMTKTNNFTKAANTDGAFIIGYGADKEDLKKAVEALASLKPLVLDGGITEWKKNKGALVGWGDPTSFEVQSKVTYISADELKKLIDEKQSLVLLDTSSASTYRSTHLPDATNIPLDSLERQRKELPHTEEIIVYGEDAMESFQSGVMLYDLGFLATRVLRGGASEWKSKGYPMAP